jgi:hypothetical protein
MPTTRISENAHHILQVLSAQTGQSHQAVLDAALEAYRRQRFVEEANAAYAALRADPAAWAEELEERALWDTTLMDGLEEE